MKFLITATFLIFGFLVTNFSQKAEAQECFIGEVRMFAGNFAPRGWALAQGQLLAISSNSALFSILGTTYGGDGRTTFGLPDLRGRSPIGQGSGPGLPSIRLGQKNGDVEVAVGPNHQHIQYAVKAKDGVDNNATSGTTKNRILFAEVDASESEEAMVSSSTGTTDSNPKDNYHPGLGINYIICLQGVYPSRS